MPESASGSPFAMDMTAADKGGEVALCDPDGFRRVDVVGRVVADVTIDGGDLQLGVGQGVPPGG